MLLGFFFEFNCILKLFSFFFENFIGIVKKAQNLEYKIAQCSLSLFLSSNENIQFL